MHVERLMDFPCLGLNIESILKFSRRYNESRASLSEPDKFHVQASPKLRRVGLFCGASLVRGAFSEMLISRSCLRAVANGSSRVVSKRHRTFLIFI